MKPGKKNYRKSNLSFADDDGGEEEVIMLQAPTRSSAAGRAQGQGTSLTPASGARPKGEKKSRMAFSSKRSHTDKGLSSALLHRYGTIEYGDSELREESMGVVTSSTPRGALEDTSVDEDITMSMGDARKVMEARGQRRIIRDARESGFISLSGQEESVVIPPPKSSIHLTAQVAALPSIIAGTVSSSTEPTDESSRSEVKEALKNLYGDDEITSVMDTPTHGTSHSTIRPLQHLDEVEDYTSTMVDEGRDQEEMISEDEDELARWETDIIRQGGMMTDKRMAKLVPQKAKRDRTSFTTPLPGPSISIPSILASLQRSENQILASKEVAEDRLVELDQRKKAWMQEAMTLEKPMEVAFKKHSYYQDLHTWVNDFVSMVEVKVPRLEALERELAALMGAYGQALDAATTLYALSWSHPATPPSTSPADHNIWDAHPLEDPASLDALLTGSMSIAINTTSFPPDLLTSAYEWADMAQETVAETALLDVRLESFMEKRASLFSDVRSDLTLPGALDSFAVWKKEHPADFHNAYAPLSLRDIATYFARWEAMTLTDVQTLSDIDTPPWIASVQEAVDNGGDPEFAGAYEKIYARSIGPHAVRIIASSSLFSWADVDALRTVLDACQAWQCDMAPLMIGIQARIEAATVMLGSLLQALERDTRHFAAFLLYSRVLLHSAVYLCGSFVHPEASNALRSALQIALRVPQGAPVLSTLTHLQLCATILFSAETIKAGDANPWWYPMLGDMAMALAHSLQAIPQPQGIHYRALIWILGRCQRAREAQQVFTWAQERGVRLS